MMKTRLIALVLTVCALWASSLFCADSRQAGMNPGLILFYHNFNANSEGAYSLEELNSDWNNPPWDNGVAEGRVKVIKDTRKEGGFALAVSYPKRTYGPTAGGAQWYLNLDANYEELYVSYYVKFPVGFDFVKGGKLPGLVGGKANTDGVKPNGSDGWSARIMWRPNGRIVQYVYHPDQPTQYGQDFQWKQGTAPVRFIPGSWHRVETRIKMNAPTVKDGVIQSWLDGKLVLDIHNLRFRDTPSLAIDKLYFSTFFGGNDRSWASAKDEKVLFDDFIVSTVPVSHRAFGGETGTSS